MEIISVSADSHDGGGLPRYRQFQIGLEPLSAPIHAVDDTGNQPLLAVDFPLEPAQDSPFTRAYAGIARGEGDGKRG
jgi:hypothetical protein